MKLSYLNYKEPLKPVLEGYGFFGTLAQTEDATEVQCHICGKLVQNLGHHAWVRHQIKAKEYRSRFQLGRTTPLCSDAWSEKCKQSKLAMWSNLSEGEREALRETMRAAQTRTERVGNPNTLEYSNKRGMCPDQLLTHLTALAKKLDHSPTFKEFETEYGGKYVGAITRTFGSWNGAKRIAGLTLSKSGSSVPHNRSMYTDEVLLEYLRSFHKEKGTLPTYGDWNRGFLPSYYLYRHRFGGIEKARRAAGLSVDK